MSAAATAAGYLYASGRLRGREKREQEAEKPETQHEPKPRPRIETPIRVAAMPSPEDTRPASAPRKTPTIQYRTRRWKPEPHGE
jgi:hypothetical protein